MLQRQVATQDGLGCQARHGVRASECYNVSKRRRSIADPRGLLENPGKHLLRDARCATMASRQRLQHSREAYATFSWALVRGFSLSFYSKETILFTIEPYYGDLN